MIKKIKNFILDVLFPKFCLNCAKEGNYLCQDCQSLLEVLEDNFCLCQKSKRLPEAGKCQQCRSKKLNGLYCALSYQNHLVKKLIQKFKYQPHIKELSKNLSSLITTHFLLLSLGFNNNTIKKKFSKSILMPVPISKKKLKQRGFNQTEEIGKELAKFLKIPLINKNLIKIKEIMPQTELKKQEREKNIKEAFSLKNKKEIKDKKILLIDDVYTTGSTMEECARILKEAGAEEVWGIVIARE